MPEFDVLMEIAFPNKEANYYELVWRRPLGVRANFASPLDGKRS